MRLDVISLLSIYETGLMILVREDGYMNYLCRRGTGGEWFRWISDFNNGFARVESKDGMCNFIDKDGVLYDENKIELPDDMQVNLKRKSE